jgi:hypothetical protein
LKIILQCEQTINSELFAYAVEVSDDEAMSPELVAEHFRSVAVELQAMADEDRNRLGVNTYRREIGTSLN